MKYFISTGRRVGKSEAQRRFKKWAETMGYEVFLMGKDKKAKAAYAGRSCGKTRTQLILFAKEQGIDVVFDEIWPEQESTE